MKDKVCLAAKNVFLKLKGKLQQLLTFRPTGYERVYLPLYKVADTPFHIQGDEFNYEGIASCLTTVIF